MKEVATLKFGQSFGELALISNKPRAATVKTLTSWYLAMLGKSDYQQIYGIIEKNKLNKKIDFFKSLPLFSSLTRDAVGKITYFFTVKNLIRNEYLFKQGDTCSHCYIVINGEFDAYQSQPSKMGGATTDTFNSKSIRSPIDRILNDRVKQAVRDKYIEEINFISSKGNIAKFGPGSVIGDIDAVSDQEKFTISVKCITQSAEVYQIKVEDLFMSELLYSIHRYQI